MSERAVAGVHHVALETTRADAAALVAFFALLGFHEVPVPAGMEDVALWAERDGTQVHALFDESPAAPRRGHVAVVCGDYEDALGRLRAAGFEPQARSPRWGSPRSYVTAPGGHRVEVMQHPPAPASGA